MQLTFPTTTNLPSKCQSCQSDKLAYIKGTGATRLIGTNVEGEGEIELVICLECGQVQGGWPMKSVQYGWSE